jgi:hypothetical protein
MQMGHLVGEDFVEKVSVSAYFSNNSTWSTSHWLITSKPWIESDKANITFSVPLGKFITWVLYYF